MGKRDHFDPALPDEPARRGATPPSGDAVAADEYAGFAARMEARQYAGRVTLAAELGPVLRIRAAAMAQATYDQKRLLTRWINAQLRRFGLGIRCPKTGRPSAMVADCGDDPARGRFQLYSEDSQGRKQRTLSSGKLPPLELIPAGSVGVEQTAIDLEKQFYAMAAPSLAPAAGNYETVATKLNKAGLGFRRAVAERLEPVINARLREMPHAKYAEKQTLSRWVNAELRRFGLAIRCPKTGLPAILLVDPGTDPACGRFQLDVRTASGRSRRTVSSIRLPHLALTADGLSRLSQRENG